MVIIFNCFLLFSVVIVRYSRPLLEKVHSSTQGVNTQAHAHIEQLNTLKPIDFSLSKSNLSFVFPMFFCVNSDNYPNFFRRNKKVYVNRERLNSFSTDVQTNAKDTKWRQIRHFSLFANCCLNSAN